MFREVNSRTPAWEWQSEFHESDEVTKQYESFIMEEN